MVFHFSRKKNYNLKCHRKYVHFSSNNKKVSKICDKQRIGSCAHLFTQPPSEIKDITHFKYLYDAIIIFDLFQDWYLRIKTEEMLKITKYLHLFN